MLCFYFVLEVSSKPSFLEAAKVSLLLVKSLAQAFNLEVLCETVDVVVVTLQDGNITMPVLA